MMNPESLEEAEINYKNDHGDSTISLGELKYFDQQQYDFLDEKSFKKYMADLERDVRGSYEYRKFISFLKYKEGMDEDVFIDNATCRDNSNIKIELHHSPLTLFDICLIVFKKRQANRESLEIWDVSEEVLWLHYAGWIGLVPLSKTTHDLVHNGYLFVPTNIVRGQYTYFINNYANFIDPDTKANLSAVEELTQLYDKELKDKQQAIFNNHNIYIDHGTNYTIPKMEHVMGLLDDQVQRIKNKKIIMAVKVDKP